MFRQYLRNSPWYSQLLILIGLIFIFSALVTLSIFPLVFQQTGVTADAVRKINEHSPASLIRASMWIQVISQLGTFGLPCLFFGFLINPKPASYLGFRKAGKNTQYLWVVVTMLGAVPFLVGVNQWMHLLPLNNFLKGMQDQNDETWGAFLNFKTVGEMFVALFAFAITPAFCEELLFRGVLMRFAHRFSVHQNAMFNRMNGTDKKAGMFFSVAVTSLLFALIHFNVYGFISILMAGILLAMIYYLTGSIWCSMLAHMMNNGLQIALLYVFRDNETWKAVVNGDAVPAFVPVIGGLIMAGGFYMLWKDRTPLPENWSAEFTAKELTERNS